MHGWHAVVAAASIVLGACTSGGPSDAADASRAPSAGASIEPWPSPPAVDAGALDADVEAAVRRLVIAFTDGSLDRDALAVVAASSDPRLAWIVSDMLRFTTGGGQVERELVAAFTRLTDVDPTTDERFGAVSWLAITNLLIAWDLPAPPGYVEHKADLFLRLEPAWEPFFADPDAAIDWRWVSWGGVFIDDREVADRRPCRRSCIPALDDPALTSAADGGWYPDERIVFGVVVGDEAVAFPKHIMEVHEMVNLSIGGRRIGLPYCTLCGSAHAFLADAVPDGVATPVLRTSGLLSRSNKVMYDLVTSSAFTTFTGRAVTGPLREAGVVLEPVTVVTSTWGEWKAAHPETRIVAEDGGIGRDYPLDPLGDRDADGPIFPIGRADPRLPAQSAVLGVIAPDGTPLAFPVELASAALAAGERVAVGDVALTRDGGGLRARLSDGTELPANESYWFAWSQFHPDTTLWSPVGS